MWKPYLSRVHQASLRTENSVPVSEVCYNVAYIASVSPGFPRKFRCFGRAEIKARAKKGRGEGERRKGNACRQTPGIWKPPTCSVTPERAHRGLKLSSAVINWPKKCFACCNGSDLSRTHAEPKQTWQDPWRGISESTRVRWRNLNESKRPIQAL